MLSYRQEEILLAVVREYIKTAQPVGSNVLLNKYNLPVCSATIRNEMVFLEEHGYLVSPHISSGRIPLDKAYRFYVDKLLSRRILVPELIKNTSRNYFRGVFEIGDLIEKTCKFLSDVTNYTSLFLAPQLRRSLFKYLKIISINSNSLMLIMLANTGKVINKIINFSYGVDNLDLNKLTNILNDKLKGSPISTVHNISTEEFLDKTHQEVVENIVKNIDSIIELEDKKIFYEGPFRLIDTPEFKNFEKLKSLIDVIKEERLITEILSGTLEHQGLKVTIGYESGFDFMKDFSVVATTYELSGKVVGGLGIIGPTRMPYEDIIPVVSYMAHAFSDKLKGIV